MKNYRHFILRFGFVPNSRNNKKFKLYLITGKNTTLQSVIEAYRKWSSSFGVVWQMRPIGELQDLQCKGINVLEDLSTPIISKIDQPLTLKSVQHVISPHITHQSNIKVKRLKQMINNCSALDCYTNSSSQYFWKGMGNSRENKYCNVRVYKA